MPLTADSLALVLLLLWAAVVAVIDWRWRRVPNAMLLLALLPALLFLLLRGTSLLPGLFGLATGLLITLPGYALSQLGGGDLKLAAVMGFLLGWSAMLWCLLLSALLLGALSLAMVALLGYEQARAQRLPAASVLSAAFAAVLLASHEAWL